VPAVTMRELLEAGVHFGHQTRRWNPKMRRFIFAERSGLYLIDLQQTIEADRDRPLLRAHVAERGGSVLFVGTKKQTQDSIRDEATRVGMPVRQTIAGSAACSRTTARSRADHAHANDLRRLRAARPSSTCCLPRSACPCCASSRSSRINHRGVAEMRRLPQAVFVIGPQEGSAAIREARRCNIPVIGARPTRTVDPYEATFVIPGRNDDAIRSCGIVARVIADGIAEGQGVARAAAAEIAAAAEAAALAAEEAAAAEAAAAEAAAAEAADAAEAPEADAAEPAAVAPEA